VGLKPETVVASLSPNVTVDAHLVAAAAWSTKTYGTYPSSPGAAISGSLFEFCPMPTRLCAPRLVPAGGNVTITGSSAVGCGPLVLSYGCLWNGTNLTNATLLPPSLNITCPVPTHAAPGDLLSAQLVYRPPARAGMLTLLWAVYKGDATCTLPEALFSQPSMSGGWDAFAVGACDPVLEDGAASGYRSL